MSVWNNTGYVGPVDKAVITSGASSNGTSAARSLSFQGCYTDARPRTLSGCSTSRNDMTQEICVSTCDGIGYKFAGLEYGSQGFCGDALGRVE
jgi:hypothetical protein